MKQKNYFDANGNLREKDAKKLVGDDERMNLEIEGPYLFHETHFFMPTPFDVCPVDENNSAAQISLSTEPLDSDLGFPLHFAQFQKKAQYLHWEQPFCSLEELNQFRTTGKMKKDEISIYVNENHIGIQLDYNNFSNKQTRESRFYMTPYNRFLEKTRFYFDLTAANNEIDLNNIYNKLGSEGRGAICETTKSQLQLKLTDDFYDKIIKDEEFKLILLQPGLFENGWLPFPEKDKQDGFKTLEYKGLQLRLIYARTVSTKKISGMSLRQQKNNQGDLNFGLKPMLNAVPAGSVYYFKILNSESKMAEILKDLDGTKIPLSDNKYLQMGFNQAVIGRISKENLE